jgi:hypothetical protein
MLVALVMSHAPLLSMVAVVRPSLSLLRGMPESNSNRPPPLTLYSAMHTPPTLDASILTSPLYWRSQSRRDTMSSSSSSTSTSSSFSTFLDKEREEEKPSPPLQRAPFLHPRARRSRARTVSRVCILLPTHGVVGWCVREVMCVG